MLLLEAVVSAVVNLIWLAAFLAVTVVSVVVAESRQGRPGGGARW